MPTGPTSHPTFFFPMGLILFALMVWSLYWVYHDARDRRKTPG